MKKSINKGLTYFLVGAQTATGVPAAYGANLKSEQRNLNPGATQRLVETNKVSDVNRLIFEVYKSKAQPSWGYLRKNGRMLQEAGLDARVAIKKRTGEAIFKDMCDTNNTENWNHVVPEAWQVQNVIARKNNGKYVLEFYHTQANTGANKIRTVELTKNLYDTLLSAYDQMQKSGKLRPAFAPLRTPKGVNPTKASVVAAAGIQGRKRKKGKALGYVALAAVIYSLLKKSDKGETAQGGWTGGDQ